MKQSDGRDPPQEVAPHATRGVVGAHELKNSDRRRFVQVPENCDINIDLGLTGVLWCVDADKHLTTGFHLCVLIHTKK